MTVIFARRTSVHQEEKGRTRASRFAVPGLLPCVTKDAGDGLVLILGRMNAEALRLTIETGEAHCCSRQAARRKGATSGPVHRVVKMRINHNQDSLRLTVDGAGARGSRHMGCKSCFYRAVPVRNKAGVPLRCMENAKLCYPAIVHGDAPNPTAL